MKNQHLKTIINPLVGSCAPELVTLPLVDNQLIPSTQWIRKKTNRSFVQTIYFTDSNGILIKRSIKHHNI